MAILRQIITKNGIQAVRLTPGRAIRQKCLECCAWNQAEVRECRAADCALYSYRMGRRPAESLEMEGV